MRPPVDHGWLCGLPKIVWRAAGPSINPARWQAMFDEMTGRIACRFSRAEHRRRAEKLLLGLVSQLPRKNCWTIAEHVGMGHRVGFEPLTHW